MAEPKSEKASVKSGRDTQAKNLKSLGGMPPKLEVKEIMKVNSPSGRGKAPDGFRPA